MLIENQRIINERFNELGKKIRNCEYDKDIKFEDGKLFYKDLELDENIEGEISRKVKSFDTIFLHGFGQLNFAEKLTKKFNETVIIILETNPSIIKAVLDKKDLSHILSNQKIFPLLIEKENINQTFSDLVNSLKQRLTWGNAFEFITTGYDKSDFYDLELIKEVFDKHYNPILLNNNTLIARSTRIGENIIKNIPDLAKGSLVDNLHNKFKDKPAVIIASGPSLSKNIDYLDKIKDKAILIAADSVSGALKLRNIKPDILCGLDYQQVNLEKYKTIMEEKEQSDIFFVHESAIHYSIPKLFKNKSFNYDIGSIVSVYEDAVGKIKLNRFGVNAVTHLAILTAHIIGANPIIFIGQDWAYSSGMGHAKGVSLDSLLPENVIWVKGNYQEKVPTDPNLHSGLKLVEDITKVLKKENIEIINATEGGAFIEGTQLMSLEESAKKYINKTINKEILHSTPKPKYDIFIQKTKEIKKTLNKIIKDSTNGIKINAQILKKWQTTKNNASIKELVAKSNKINDEITFNKVFANFVTTYYFKDFFYFYQEEMDITGQKTDERIKQSSKYFNIIKKKTSNLVNIIDELYNYLELEKKFYENEEKFLKKVDNVLKLAEIYFNFKDIYTGIDMLKKALKIHTENENIYYWIAKLYSLNRFTYKESLQNFEKALQINPNFKRAKFDYGVEKYKIQSHLILAKQALQRNDFVRAKNLVVRALDYEPNNEKIKKWLKIVEEYATYAKDQRQQDILFKQLSLESEAYDEYKKAIELVKSQKMDEAYENLLKIYKNYGMFGDVPFLLGSILLDRGDTIQAEKYLLEAIELIPYQPLVYVALGKLYLVKEDYLRAKENIEKAIKMNDKLKMELSDTLGNLQYQFDEYENALQSFNDFLPYSNDKKKTITKIALCYKEMGKIEEYNQLIDKIRELDSAN